MGLSLIAPQQIIGKPLEECAQQDLFFCQTKWLSAFLGIQYLNAMNKKYSYPAALLPPLVGGLDGADVGCAAAGALELAGAEGAAPAPLGISTSFQSSPSPTINAMSVPTLMSFESSGNCKFHHEFLDF